MNETITKTKTNFMKKIITLVAKNKQFSLVLLAFAALALVIVFTAIYMTAHPSILN